jgi:hypothetical protein
MEEVMKHPEEIPQWHAAGRGEPVDWNGLLAGYGAAVDWPSAQFWRELATHWPKAKVILTVRDTESWYRSIAGTILVLMARRAEAPNPTVRAILDMTDDVIAKRAFAGRLDDADHVKRSFERHNAEVKAGLPPDRLLVFEVAQGWEPLCRFLGAPVPATPFPRTNSAQEFWDLIAQGPGARGA